MKTRKERYEYVKKLYYELQYPEEATDPIIAKAKDVHLKNQYGRGFLGKGVVEHPIIVGAKSICDVGCGTGNFILEMDKQNKKVYGVDIVKARGLDDKLKDTKITVFETPAWSIPLPDKSVDILTSFDTLEHIPPEEVFDTLKEFFRITKKGFVFNICYIKDSGEGIYNPPLHLTIKPEDWWTTQILLQDKDNNMKVKKYGSYLIFEF